MRVNPVSGDLRRGLFFMMRGFLGGKGKGVRSGRNHTPVSNATVEAYCFVVSRGACAVVPTDR